MQSIMDAADESGGIYARSVTSTAGPAPGDYAERTPYMEGWNAAMMDMSAPLNRMVIVAKEALDTQPQSRAETD